MKDKLSKIEVFKFNQKKCSELVCDSNNCATHSSYLNSYADFLDVFSSSPKDRILFFKPDFYWDNNEWIQVCDKANNVFDLDTKCVVGYSKRSSGFDGIHLELGVDSEVEIYEFKEFSFKIKDADSSELQKRCLSSCSSSFFRCTNLSFNESSCEVSEVNGKLFFKSSGELKGSVWFWYSAYIQDRVCFKYCKSSDTKKKINHVRKIMHDKKHEYVKEWSKEAEYSTNDVVCYDGARYRAKKAVKGESNPLNGSSDSWEKLGILRSLFEGQSVVLKKTLGYYIEKKIGDRIRLILMNLPQDPRLNDSFVYGDKKYRIIEIVCRYYGAIKKTIVQGLELLDIKIDFQLNFKNDLQQLCDVKFDASNAKVVFSAPSKYASLHDQEVLLKTENVLSNNRLEDSDVTKI